ncbi:NAD(P)-dependent dehydrogenase (short-subunit alcohol dehydrogenase family) [Acidovorax soli]|uniref:NAD(P)-dependent dehydrogenase (Short-subunit alcohol dehydrogenase family) n=1 Tax=Acidovorax soli TaxID=592050 RepID=A0A7X0PK50_9BURK|nr:SDR family oxidoreductase [Acidovorax soli]MBB6562881.1 NAD(P)-dependent dehydrogenase (short-subunit alcohol dehydrogenase family) [Acidovorax soli]
MSNPSASLAGLSVLITGGGTGIGAAVAQQCVAAGARVALMGRRLAPLQAVAQPLGALAVAGDAADAADVRRALAQVRDAHGGIDVLVANAGGHGIGNALGTDDASWALSARLNLDTAFVCAREALPGLMERRGNIVILSSLAGHFAGPDAVGYVTMKHALIGLTRSLARDYGRHGVRANAVCPGWVRTDMADEQMAVLVQRHGLTGVDAAYDLVTRHVPLGRPATPDDVAQAVLFLASPQAAMVSGSALMVDGGASAVDLPTLAFAE